MSTENYDLIVIGSGPGGEKGAAQAAYFGKKVAIIEREKVPGGAAANTGTLPSKTLRESALYLSGFRQRELHGVDTQIKSKVTAQDFLFHERFVVQGEHQRICNNIKRHSITYLTGTASFIDPQTIKIKPENKDEMIITGDVILIATGSSPYRAPIFPFEDPRVFDSDTILNLKELPSSILIAGGGVIGCEYACMFSALGIDVSLVEGREKLLSFMDPEVADSLTRCMRNMGIKLYLKEEIQSVEANNQIETLLKNGHLIQTEALLTATGRNGNTHDLNLENIGLKSGKRGQLEVNQSYQTTCPNIYAVGDVIGFPALASTSMEQARVAMVHAFDLEYKTELAHVLPYGIYTIPECSMAGATEEFLNKENIDYVVGRATYQSNSRGQIIGDQDGFLKLIFCKEDMKLLGVHVIGEAASELVHVDLTALLTGAGADLFIQTCYNYPTLSEMYKYATYDALGERNKTSKIAAE